MPILKITPVPNVIPVVDVVLMQINVHAVQLDLSYTNTNVSLYVQMDIMENSNNVNHVIQLV
jgi:hypothetical protein